MKRYCCDGLCQQGRYCCEFMPAESSTEIGFDDDHLIDPWAKRIEDFVIALALTILAITLAWWLV